MDEAKIKFCDMSADDKEFAITCAKKALSIFSFYIIINPEKKNWLMAKLVDIMSFLNQLNRNLKNNLEEFG